MRTEDERTFDEGLAKILQFSTPDVKLVFDLHSKELKDLVDRIDDESGRSPEVLESRRILLKKYHDAGGILDA